MYFVVGHAETFNYKTNYEAADVSPLTQSNPPSSRTGHFQEVKRSKGDGIKRYVEEYLAVTTSLIYISTHSFPNRAISSAKMVK